MSGLVIDKIFYEGNCSTPWLMTREPVAALNCLNVNSIRCTNNTLQAYFAQSCTLDSTEKDVPFTNVKVKTAKSLKYGGPYEFIYKADGQCRRYNTLIGPNGFGYKAICDGEGKPMIQQCDKSCLNCTDVDMGKYYVEAECTVVTTSMAPSISSLFVLITLLVNIL